MEISAALRGVNIWTASPEVLSSLTEIRDGLITSVARLDWQIRVHSSSMVKSPVIWASHVKPSSSHQAWKASKLSQSIRASSTGRGLTALSVSR